MLQFPLKLKKTANGKFSFQVFSKKVGGESRAAAGCFQRVACGGAVTVSHAHTGLGTNDALDLCGCRGCYVRTKVVYLLFMYTHMLIVALPAQTPPGPPLRHRSDQTS